MKRKNSLVEKRVFDCYFLGGKSPGRSLNGSHQPNLRRLTIPFFFLSQFKAIVMFFLMKSKWKFYPNRTVILLVQHALRIPSQEFRRFQKVGDGN